MIQISRISKTIIKQFQKTNIFNFCKTKLYTAQYQNLKIQLHQQKQKLQRLQQKALLLQKISETTFIELLIKQLYQKIPGKTYQTKAIRHHREILLRLRNELQQKIQQSALKWQQPRRLILQQRQRQVNDFLQKIIKFQRQMAQFIFSRKSQGEKQELKLQLEEGILLNHKILVKNILKEDGVEIRPEVPQKYDEKEHEVRQQKERKQSGLSNSKNNKDKLKIVNVLIPGWKVKDKVIVKAVVQVK